MTIPTDNQRVLSFCGAQNKTRTCTTLRSLVPETSVSTNFTIWAWESRCKYRPNFRFTKGNDPFFRFLSLSGRFSGKWASGWVDQRLATSGWQLADEARCRKLAASCISERFKVLQLPPIPSEHQLLQILPQEVIKHRIKVHRGISSTEVVVAVRIHHHLELDSCLDHRLCKFH